MVLVKQNFNYNGGGAWQLVDYNLSKLAAHNNSSFFFIHDSSRIQERRVSLLAQIEDVRRTRAIQRSSRKRHGGSFGQELVTVAVVGYTNAVCGCTKIVLSPNISLMTTFLQNIPMENIFKLSTDLLKPSSFMLFL